MGDNSYLCFNVVTSKLAYRVKCKTAFFTGIKFMADRVIRKLP